MKSTNTVVVMVLSVLLMKFKLVLVASENICGHMRLGTTLTINQKYPQLIESIYDKYTDFEMSSDTGLLQLLTKLLTSN